MTRQPDDHLSDEQLLLHVDGELTGRDADAATAHLDACWKCRTRLDDLQATIHTIVRFEDEVLLPHVPPPPKPWPGLRPRLEDAGRDLDARSMVRRILHVFAPRSSNANESSRSSRWSLHRVVATATVLMVAVWLGTHSASAAAARRALARFGDYVATLVRKPSSIAPTPSVTVARRPAPEPAPALPRVAPRVDATRPAARRLTAAELIDLELEAVARLDRVGAFLGEQLSVQRDSRRAQVRIQGIVETAQRKEDILAAVGSLSSHHAVSIHVQTVAEALGRQTTSSIGQPTVRAVEIAKSRVPVHEDLRRYILEPSRRRALGLADGDPTEATIEREIQVLTVRILSRSLQARLHARALNDAAGRVSQAELPQLSMDARKRWHRILRQHASAFQREAAALRTDLEGIFIVGPVSDETDLDVPVTSDADLASAAARLFELGSSHDATIARTFSRSADEPNPQPPAWESFFRSVRVAERLAARIEKLASSE